MRAVICYYMDQNFDVDPIARMESFRALQLSRLENFLTPNSSDPKGKQISNRYIGPTLVVGQGVLHTILILGGIELHLGVTITVLKWSPAQILKMYRPTNKELAFLSMMCDEQKPEHERKFLTNSPLYFRSAKRGFVQIFKTCQT